MRALLLVDIQNDFLPGGALAVPEGDQVIPAANRLQTQFDLVVATQDWHPADHGSFAANHPGKRPGDIIELNGLRQILWPVHCVQNTPGAAFGPELNTSQFAQVFRKGTDPGIRQLQRLLRQRPSQSNRPGQLPESAERDRRVHCGSNHRLLCQVHGARRRGPGLPDPRATGRLPGRESQPWGRSPGYCRDEECGRGGESLVCFFISPTIFSSRRPYSTKFLRMASSLPALDWASWKTTTMWGSMESPPS